MAATRGGSFAWLKAKLCSTFQGLSSSESTTSPSLREDELGFQILEVSDDTTPPEKSRTINFFTMPANNTPFARSYHETKIVTKKDKEGKIKKYVLKKVQKEHDLPDTDTQLKVRASYLIEAFNSDLYKLLAPHYCSTSRAHYDEKNNHVGVSSKFIPNFVPVAENPLLLSDIEVNLITSGQVTIEEFQALENKMRLDGNSPFDIPDGHVIWVKIVNETTSISVTGKDLKNYLYDKGNGISITNDEIREEGDNHTGNRDKIGNRVDFDLMGEYAFLFKSSNMVERFLRFPDKAKDMFAITTENIRHSPNLPDSARIYWPGKCKPRINQPIDTVGSIVIASKNAYQSSQLDVYEALEKNPVFVYYKFATYLKYLLIDPSYYKKLVNLYFPPHIMVEGISLRELIAQHLKKRYEKYRNTLADMPEFQEFIAKYGATALEEIKKDFAQHDANLIKKIPKHPVYRELLMLVKPAAPTQNDEPFIPNSLTTLLTEKSECYLEYKALQSTIKPNEYEFSHLIDERYQKLQQRIISGANITKAEEEFACVDDYVGLQLSPSRKTSP